MERLQQAGASALRHLEPARADDPQLIKRLRLRDILMTQHQVLSAMRFALKNTDDGVLITRDGQSSLRGARPLPERELWFERVWSTYRMKG